MYIPARDSAEFPVLSIALKVKQLWFVGGAIVT